MNRSRPADRVQYYPKRPQYKLLPINFARSERIGSDLLVSSLTGEFQFISQDNFSSFCQGALPRGSDIYRDLFARHMLYEEELHEPQEEMAAQIRSKKAYVLNGPALHIFVVTLRCDHSCQYCQVSRRVETTSKFDMTPEIAEAAINRVFESSASELTIEFQGGEPLLAFPIIRKIVEDINERNEIEKRRINFVITSTLHFLTDEILGFCLNKGIQFSTSLDGPAYVHNKNRPLKGNNSYEKTIEGIMRARARVGANNVSALTTITNLSIKYPKEIVDEYVDRGFHSIFLRPLSPYGFAVKTQNRIGYDMASFLEFYEEALAYIIRLNRKGVHIEEGYTTLLLRHILTPFPTGYVDLRSPSGAGIGVLVYNYDGYVYPSDEARMLVEMGDTDLRLGMVSDTYDILFTSAAMQALLEGSMNEFIPGCDSCVYQPFCGADPVGNYATSRDPIGFKPSSSFCKRHLGTFDILFEYLHKNDPDTINIFLKWLRRRDVDISSRKTYL